MKAMEKADQIKQPRKHMLHFIYSSITLLVRFFVFFDIDFSSLKSVYSIFQHPMSEPEQRRAIKFFWKEK
jgi:hypothetical protein